MKVTFLEDFVFVWLKGPYWAPKLFFVDNIFCI